MSDDAAAVRFTVTRENTASGGDAPRPFKLKFEAETPIRIGRAPGNDLIVSSRGVSQYHCELRVVRPNGDSSVRLCVRDLSMNGTGLKRPDGKAPVHINKGTDVPVEDGSVILVPMMLKVSQDTTDRAWLRIDLDGSSLEAANEAAAEGAEAAQNSAEADGGAGATEADTEKNRMKFVELLLNTREVSAGTTYDDARKLLGSAPDWHAVDETTRKECFDIFVEHLCSHESKKKKDKKKGKDKDKGKKSKGKEEEAGAPKAATLATPEPKAHQREDKKRRGRQGSRSADGGSPERKRKREKKGARRSKSRAGRSASAGEKRRRRRSGSA